MNMKYKSSSVVLLALWVCLLNHSTGLPLTLAEAAQNLTANSTRLSRVDEQDKSTQLDHKENTDSPPLDVIVENENKRTGDDNENSNIDLINDDISQKGQDNTVEIDRNITSKHLNTSIIVLKSKAGPLIQTSENKTNVYVLASVLDMEKGLYYIPSNASANTSEGWVFWKIPHLYKLSNPTSATPYDDYTTSNNTEGSNHNFYFLMLVLGCFICGLMIMLIITLIILTRRFSNRSRPPPRNFAREPPLIVEADPNAPKVGEDYDQATFCENMDYYTLPYGPGVQRMRRFSSDDALDLLRRRAGPPLPPHYCACQRCVYQEEIMQPADDNEGEYVINEDDDVPLLNLEHSHNESDALGERTYSRNFYSPPMNTDDDRLLLAINDDQHSQTRATSMPQNHASIRIQSQTEPKYTLSQTLDTLRNSPRTLYTHSNHRNSRCRSEPWIELSSEPNTLSSSTELQDCYRDRENDQLTLNTLVSDIDAIPCATMDSVSIAAQPHPPLVLSDAIDVNRSQGKRSDMSLGSSRGNEACGLTNSLRDHNTV